MEALNLYENTNDSDGNTWAEGDTSPFETHKGLRNILTLDRVKEIKPRLHALTRKDRVDDYEQEKNEEAPKTEQEPLLLTQGRYSPPLLLLESCSGIGRFLDKVILGDCLEKLRDIPENSVDLIVTDPPYGIMFMGKDWDKAVPSIEIWKECLRVLKPGGFAYIMCGPRQDCLSRMIKNLEEAEFKVSFSPIFWTYAQGFPKAYNVAKGIEGKLKLGSANWSYWKKLPGKKGVNDLGYSKMQNQQGYRTANYQGKERNLTVDYETEEAIRFQGSYGGFQPKPAVEVIIVAMKPMHEKTYVGQALKNGKGITWLDNCRIPYANNADKEQYIFNIDGNQRTRKTSGEKLGLYEGGWKVDKCKKVLLKGRFPANLLISDDILEDNRKHPGGSFPAKRGQTDHFGLNEKESKRVGPMGDNGGFSRFFSLDAWAEKNLPFLIVPKASKKEKNAGGEDLDPKSIDRTKLAVKCKKCDKYPISSNQNNRCNCENPEWEKTKQHNFHPTVKPIKLMSYLITMGSREGDVVLDPFCGSASTCIAAKNLNRRFVGIEINREYHQIALRRTANAKVLPKLKEAKMHTIISESKTKGRKMSPRIIRRGEGDFPSVYRPCRISEFYGQDEVKIPIKEWLDKGMLPHTLLFQGVSGTGKTAMGRIVAMGLNCEKGPTSEPCGECEFCRAVLAHNSFAFQEFDAGYFPGVDKVRMERQNFDAASMGGEKYRVILFDECQRLTPEAQAALLKPVEDCHQDLYFIFCTTDAEKMMVPLRNRCMQFEFKRLEPAELRTLLHDICESENLDPDTDIIKNIIQEAEGMPRNAVLLLQKAVGLGKLVKRVEPMYASFAN